MGATGVYGLPYPELGDVPNVPQDVQDLAEEVEDELVRIDADVDGVQAVTALFATGAIQVSTQNTAGTTTATSYTATLSGGTTCSAVFVAPPSGAMLILHAGHSANSGAGSCCTSYEVRTGGTVGSGTVFKAAADTDAILNPGADGLRTAMFDVVTGLTAGSTYNTRLMFRATSGTGTFQSKKLLVAPLFI